MRIAPCTWLFGRLLTQEGSWLCQTSVWPRVFMELAWAKESSRSPGPKLKLPGEDSTVSHFISLVGVSTPNWLLARPVMVALPRSNWEIAVPK
ncbi:hypothetical protein GCM10020229_71410 [Kitasatospora albolonga]